MTSSGETYCPILEPRTSRERVAYLQGYLAGLGAAERQPGNVLLLRALMTDELEAEAEKAQKED